MARGDDTLASGDGFDVAVFSGDGSSYTLSVTTDALMVQGPDGTDTVTYVERLQFADGTINQSYTGLIDATLFTATFGTDDRNPRMVADVDGNGRVDLIGFGEAGVWISLADGTFGPAFLASDRYGASAASGGWSSQNLYTRALGDTDGDGIADLIGFGGAGVYGAYGDGSGGFGPRSWRSRHSAARARRAAGRPQRVSARARRLDRRRGDGLDRVRP